MIKVNINNELVNVYNINEIEEVIKLVLDDIKWVYKLAYSNDKRYREYNLNIPASFDIETSSWYEDSDGNLISNDDANKLTKKEKDKLNKRACMYCWQFSIGFNGGNVIMGRTWQEFIDLLATLKEVFSLDKKHILNIYVHNLSFEFHWLKGYFTWGNIFSNSDVVYYAETQGLYYEDDDMPGKLKIGVCEFDGFRFRDSYILSGVKEEKLNKVMNHYGDKCHKLEGFNYDLIRHSETPLSNDEYAYCINDVRTVNWYIQDRMKDTENNSITEVKLTKTSYVRDFIRNNLFYSDDNIKSTKDSKYINYRKLLDDMKIDFPTYCQLKRSFMGGFTHAGHINAGKVLYNVCSYDIASSYPSVLVYEMFPLSSFEKIEVNTKKELLDILQNYCCLLDVHITGLKEHYDENIDTGYEHILSLNKCVEFASAFGKEYEPKNYDLDNGRIISADDVYFSCNEVDLSDILEFYEIDNIEVSNVRIAKKGYLPKGLIEAILKLFKEKTEYKPFDKSGKPEEILYKVAKIFINSVYGCMVSDILQNEYEFKDNNFIVKEYNNEELAEKLNKVLDCKSTFLSYSWGVWCTSYARHNLYKAIRNSSYNHVYSDTDSEKFLYDEKLVDFYKEYNKMIDYKMNLAFKYHNLPKDSHKAYYVKDGKKIEKCLGYFEYEGMYDKFATCGAKRYITEKDGEIEITVAGLSKKCVDYLKDTYKEDLFTKFANADIVVPREYTNKLAATYINHSTKGYVTDYLGNKIKYGELTSVHFDKVPFELNITSEYADYLSDNFIKEYEERII